MSERPPRPPYRDPAWGLRQVRPDDLFAKDRELLGNVAHTLGEMCVTLGEWAADNLMDDPGLGEALSLAMTARGAAEAAMVLTQRAKELLPPAS